MYTYVITRQPVNPAFRERLPWGVVEVELEEGVYLISNLVDCDADDIEIGMEVEVVFEAVNDEINPCPSSGESDSSHIPAGFALTFSARYVKIVEWSIAAPVPLPT